MRKGKQNEVRDSLLSLLILGSATLFGFCFHYWGIQETNIVVLYIFSVLLVARFTKGYLYGISASIITTLLFNFLFTVPYFSLKVDDMTCLITFAIMMFISIMTSTLATKVKQTVLEVKEQEAETSALYQMTSRLTTAEDADTIAAILVQAVGETLHCNAACVSFDENGMPEKTFLQRREDGKIIHRELIDGEAIRRGIEQCRGATYVTDREYSYPIYGKATILAVLRIPAEIASGITPMQNRMLHSIVESTALAFERLRSWQAQARSREETAQERYRSNLLRAISHDVRTPLLGIMGTSEMLIGMTAPDDPRYSLAKDVYKDANWLHGFVENILSLTKLQEGKLILNKQQEAVEEVIGVALTIIERRWPDHNITVEMPESVVMVPMDAKLISQVLVNLLDNASKHTDKSSEISVCVRVDESQVSITVADRGCGIAEQDLPHIFQTFYTTYNKNPDAKQRGVGLGLAISQSIVEAHGGSIRAENRKDGGAAFTFTLPLEVN